MYFEKILSIILVISMLMTGCSIKSDDLSGKTDKNEDPILEDQNKKEENIESKIEEPIDHIKIRLEQMSVEEKIGQLVLVGMEGYEQNNNIKDLIEYHHVGGVILYGKNVKDGNQLLSLINSLKAMNSTNKAPLFISVDEEGGSVSRNPKEVKKLPKARSIGNTRDSNLAFEVGKLLGDTVKMFGYNMNFAPVLDIDSNPLNPVIGDRSFGQTVDIVSAMGTQVLKGIRETGVIPVIKHFPGHGDTSVDSHIGLPVINHDIERIRNFEILPFKNAVNSGADVVMVAHILMSQIDPEYPSSMSSVVINDMLRNELRFDGVIITDDMTMGAIEKNYNIGNAAIRSINAGADIILVGHGYEKAVTVINAIKQEIETKNIPMERVDESVYRILKLKSEYELEDVPIEDFDIVLINKSITKIAEKIKSLNAD